VSSSTSRESRASWNFFERLGEKRILIVTDRPQLDGRDQSWDVRKAERRDAKGNVLWRVTNDDFKDHAGVRLPGTSDVQEPPHGADAEIKFRSVEPNVQLGDDLFVLPPPSGLTPEPADC